MLRYFDKKFLDSIDFYNSNFIGLPYVDNKTLIINVGGVAFEGDTYDIEKCIIDKEGKMYLSGVATMRFKDIFCYKISHWKQFQTENATIHYVNNGCEIKEKYEFEPVPIYYKEENALRNKILRTIEPKKSDELALKLDYISIEILGVSTFELEFDESNLIDFDKYNKNIHKYIFFNNI